MYKNSVVKLLIAALLFSNSTLIILLYKKKQVSSPVTVMFEGKNSGYVYDDQMAINDFWNNYPYVTATNEGKWIDTIVRLNNQPSHNIYELRGNVIYRYFQTGDDKDSTLHIVKGLPGVVIITDSLSLNSLNEEKTRLQLTNATFVLSKKKMNNACEKMELSYFFSVSRSKKLINLYFPRVEVPEITEKYLKHNIKRAAFF